MKFDVFNIIITSAIDGVMEVDHSQFTSREDQAIIFAKWKLTNRTPQISEVTIIAYTEDKDSDEPIYLDRLTNKTYLYNLKRYNQTVFVESYVNQESWLEPQIKV